jgi:disulfide bond formation protein DsbB
MNKYGLIAALGSLALLLGAFGFQFIGGMPPCKLCLFQRYPHAVAIAAGLLVLALKSRIFYFIGFLAALTTSGIGFYHAGVEQGWWQGPTTCTSGSVTGLSTEALLDQIMAAPVVRCDDIPWDLLGISIAGWNGIFSLFLAALWFVALRQKSA